MITDALMALAGVIGGIAFGLSLPMMRLKRTPKPPEHEHYVFGERLTREREVEELERLYSETWGER